MSKQIIKVAHFILMSFMAIFLSVVQASQYDEDLLRLTNWERQKEGLPALTLSSHLGGVAQSHVTEMAVNHYFSHTGLNGSNVLDRTKSVGYDSSHVGENIATGQPTTEAVIRDWMNSPGHRANILNPNFTEIGFGYDYSSSSIYGHYWGQVFGKAKLNGGLLTQRIKAESIFNQVEQVYSRYIYPHANTIESGEVYVRYYNNSPVSSVTIDPQTGAIWYISNHQENYFLTLDEANRMLCASKCF